MERSGRRGGRLVLRRRQRFGREQRAHVRHAQAEVMAKANARSTIGTVIARLRQEARENPWRISCFSVRAGHPRRRTLGQGPISICADRSEHLDELNHWAPKLLAQAAASIRKSRTSPATSNSAGCRTTSSSTATPPRASAFSRRRSTTRSTTPLASGRSRSFTRSKTSITSFSKSIRSFQLSPDSLDKIYVKSTTGTRCR